jgi:hypothetical protein
MRMKGPNSFAIPSITEAEGACAGNRVEILWYDNEVAKLRVVADSGDLRAVADMSSDKGVFKRVARALDGFPTSENDGSPHRHVGKGHSRSPGATVAMSPIASRGLV